MIFLTGSLFNVKKHNKGDRNHGAYANDLFVKISSYETTTQSLILGTQPYAWTVTSTSVDVLDLLRLNVSTTYLGSDVRRGVRRGDGSVVPHHWIGGSLQNSHLVVGKYVCNEGPVGGMFVSY